MVWVKVKEKDYKKRPHAADGSMPGIAPGKNSIRASEYSRVIRGTGLQAATQAAAQSCIESERTPVKRFLTQRSTRETSKWSVLIFQEERPVSDSRFIKQTKQYRWRKKPAHEL